MYARTAIALILPALLSTATVAQEVDNPFDPPTLEERNASGSEYYMLEVPSGAVMTMDGVADDWAWYDPAFVLTQDGWRDEGARSLPHDGRDLEITTRMAWSGAPDNRWLVFMHIHDDIANHSSDVIERWSGDAIQAGLDPQDHGRSECTGWQMEFIGAPGALDPGSFGYRQRSSRCGNPNWDQYGDPPWFQGTIRVEPPEALQTGPEGWSSATGVDVYYEFSYTPLDFMELDGPAASKVTDLDAKAQANGGAGLAFNLWVEDGDPDLNNDMTVRGAVAALRQYYAHAVLLSVGEYLDHEGVPRLARLTPQPLRLPFSEPGAGAVEDGSPGETMLAVQLRGDDGLPIQGQSVTWSVSNTGQGSVHVLAPTLTDVASGTQVDIIGTTDAQGEAMLVLDAGGDLIAPEAAAEINAQTSADDMNGAPHSLTQFFSVSWAPTMRAIVIHELTDGDIAALDLGDASIADWEAALGPPTLTATDFILRSEVGEGAPYDPADLDFRIWLGWHDASGKIYGAIERVDDVYINDYPGGDPLALWQYDGMELEIDGDWSGGRYGYFDWNCPECGYRERLVQHNRQAQQFLVVPEAPDGVLLGYLGAAAGVDWVTRPPYGDAGGGISGIGPTVSVTEFYLTPFDNLIRDKPVESTPSPLFAHKVVGIGISVPDFDQSSGAYHAYHQLVYDPDHNTNADDFVAAVLVPDDAATPPGVAPTSRLRVNYPDGGESLGATTTQRIHWFADPDIAEVNVEYSLDNGVSWSTVETNAENTGTLDWFVPPALSTEVLVLVSDAADLDPVDVSDDVFTIRNEVFFDLAHRPRVNDPLDAGLWVTQFGVDLNGDTQVDLADYEVLVTQAFFVTFNGSIFNSVPQSAGRIEFDWEDGVPVEVVPIVDGAFHVGHVYTSPGSYDILFIAFDDNDYGVPQTRDFLLSEVDVTLIGPRDLEDVGPQQSVHFSVMAHNLTDVAHVELWVELVPWEAFDALAIGHVPPPGFASTNLEVMDNTVRINAESLAGGISGDLDLGILALQMSPDFNPPAEAQVRLLEVTLRNGAHEVEVLFADQMGIVLTINRLRMQARPTTAAITIDGIINPGEYVDATPVYVEFGDPAAVPGIVPDWIPLPADAADLSYEILTVYDAADLFVAVHVYDDVLQDDSEIPWQDDDIEIFLDPDYVGNDIEAGTPNPEGFRVYMDVGGDYSTDGPVFGQEWTAAASATGDGWAGEFKFPLASLDTQDGPGSTPPGPGSRIRFNVTVGDDDNGGGPYEDPDDGYGAWSGSHHDWSVFQETSWGELMFSEGGPAIVVDAFDIVVRGPDSDCGVNPPFDCTTLTVGFADGATDGLDPQLGELEVPPPPPTPQVFDTRFILPDIEGLLRDLRDPNAQSPEWNMEIRAGIGGYPITLTWDPQSLPPGSWIMAPTVPGSQGIDVDMTIDNTLVITDPAVTNVVIAAESSPNPVVTYGAGWTMVSLPVTPPDGTIGVLFPDAISAFKFTDGYQQVTALVPCTGYWLNLTTGGSYTLSGSAVGQCDSQLPDSWSMQGVPLRGTRAEDILQNPPDNLASVFGFEGGYVLKTGADLLTEGQGFWFNMASAGQVILNSDPGGVARVVPLARQVYDGPVLWVQSGEHRQEIQLGVDADQVTALPPLPVPGVLDARVLVGDLSSWQVPRSAQVTDYAMLVQGPEVTLGWDVPALQDGDWELLFGDQALALSGQGSLALEELVTPARLTLRQVSTTPQAYNLHNNYPNPFNPSTTISYDLRQDGPVSLLVYDITGQRIRELVASTQPAGSYTTAWDGLDQTGALVASGIYVVELRAGDYRAVRKMLLMK
jgi:hypothetical protein